jgi:hypothetical protein
MDDDALIPIEVDEVSFVGPPPPLPVTLGLRKAEPEDDDAWLRKLPSTARAVLEAARRPAMQWPVAPRLHGAIAKPIGRA